MVSCELLLLTNMEAHSISLAVGNILEDFISQVKYCSQAITVKYFAVKRPYGSKVVISGKDKKTNKTIFYFLVKIRSTGELECLKHMINGIQLSLSKYYKSPTQIDSD